MELFEGRSGRVGAKRHGVEAHAVEVSDDFWPKEDVIDPVVEWGFDPRAVGNEDNARWMVTTGPEWKVGGNSGVVHDGRRRGRRGAAT